ncbi:hypothetical protein PRUPE_1G468600 [Prunus persica]|uniref:Uncharacterized protein n=1 Tax=Prunus persica TaxID=3760 RepID=A0A251RDR8_PRUPE|nr:cysteine-rich receptor-like protein kinase 29 [Prunus persica]ONI34219.1 hypothetical protein PRUPE_1G468600 [Prunus persica]
MVSSSSHSLLSRITLVIITINLNTQLIFAQPRYLSKFCFPNEGNYTTNSTYRTNLNRLLSTSLLSNGNGHGFYSSSSTQNDLERICAIGLCTGDINPDACGSCLSNSTIFIAQACPNQKVAVLWREVCMLRYSNRSIRGFMEAGAIFYTTSSGNMSSSNVGRFNRQLMTLLERLRGEAAAGGDLVKFAVGNVSKNNVISQTIYGLAQCTPDLTELDCNNCLVSIAGDIPQCCYGKLGGRLGTPSCYIYKYISPLLHWDIYLQALQFDFASIRVATNNFSEENKLGWGGFGDVYRGTLLSGEDIAVKRLSTDSALGDLEFKNEVLLVARLQHRNLVRLLGFCLEGNERLLVYEFVPNASLDQFIFDPIKCANLVWESRYKIILGIGWGLLFPHEDSRFRIIHCDLKTSNILLDAEMNAKISDFGMTKLFMLDQRQGETIRIVGTYGYMAHEYGYFYDKSDVYSFGVLVLEIISGQKMCSSRHEENEDLLSYARKNWKEGTASNLIDPTLRTGSRTDEIMRCIQIGLLWLQQSMAARPTMASVILMLTSSSLSLPVPSQPPFFMIELEMSGVVG